MTQQLPETDKHNYTKEFIEGQITILMGGRCAEKMFLDTETTGAANDIEVATERARKMVTEWGMSPAMGPLTFGKKEEQIFLGREISQHRDYSEDTAIRIDQEVKRIVEEGYSRAWTCPRGNRETLIRWRKRSWNSKPSTAWEIEAIIKGQPFDQNQPRRRPTPIPRAARKGKGARAIRRCRSSSTRRESLRRPKTKTLGSVSAQVDWGRSYCRPVVLV